MKAGLYFENVWFDNDAIELKITASDGVSRFSTNVYVGYSEIDDLVKRLHVFKKQIYGGIFDIELGGFGPEYANGAFSGRMHFYERGKIYITARMQSKFCDFGVKNVASDATLYLISEPALLDNFITELRVINTDLSNKAVLECQ
jgi:hypothetical protein